jgi:protease I
MSNELEGKTIAFLTANEGVEEVELTSPWAAVQDAGGIALLIAPKVGDVQAMNHLDRGSTFIATVAVADAVTSDYDGLVLPGGVSNPDQLRMQPDAVSFIAKMASEGKPIATICHGPWTLIEADLVEGRTLTSWPSLQTDIVNAGGKWVDREVVVSASGTNVIVSSRSPEDLPAFNQKAIEAFASATAGLSVQR